MRLFKAAARWLSLLLLPLTVSALGLGDIAVKSALNQPFVAEIPLESLEATELSELTVELASPETFRRYGLDRPAYLSTLRFSVESNASGEPVIRLTSVQPVAEPFITLLLDVRWPSGRLLREYTALLDPPLFEGTPVPAAIAPAQTAPEVPAAPSAGIVDRPIPSVPAQPDAKVVEPTGLFQQPREPAAVGTSPDESVSAPATTAAASAQPEEATPASPVSESAAGTAIAPAGQGYDTYTARNGDTLWGIAQRVRGGTGLSINQMMLALYRANPEAFMGNINALKSGAVIRIAPADADNAPTAAEANAEVRQQNSAWKGNAASERGAAGAASGASVAEAPGARLQLVPPAGDSTVEQPAQPASAANSDAGAVGANEGQLQSRITTLQQQLDESKRLLSIRDAEMQALQQRIAELEKSGATATAASPQLAEDSQADETTAGTSPPDVEEPLSEAPVVEPQPAVAPAAEQSPDDEPAPQQETVATAAGEEISGDGFAGSTLIWVGVAGLVLLLAGFVVRRRRAAATDGDADDWTDNRKNIDLGNIPQDVSRVPAERSPVVVEESRFSQADAAETFGSDISDGPAAKPVQDFSSTAGATDKFTVDDFSAGDLETQDAVGQDEVELPLEKTISTGAPLNLDQADPVAEAEFHMAYGLYDQAADLLTRALRDDPDNRAYRLKLIEVFFVWENKDGFLEQARALRAGGVNPADPDWNKVLILGKQLCPSDPLFSGATSSPGAGSMDLVLSDAGETSIDFTVSADDAAGIDINFDPSIGNGDELDFDLSSGLAKSDSGSYPGKADASGIATIAIDSSTVDFDLDGADDARTMESPTLDVIGAGSPTVAVDFNLDGGETMESPTLQSPANEPTLESPGLPGAGIRKSVDGQSSSLSAMAGMFDAEPPTDPTGIDIDLSGLADLPLDGDDFGSLDSGATGSSADFRGPVFGDDSKRLAPETENIYVGNEGATMFANIEQLGKVAGDTHEVPASVKSGDTVEQPEFNDGASDTAEQPGLSGSDEFSGDFDDLILSGESRFPDDATMTEVGTKLDLARAYIDMGDPEGARSILEEVLDEGGEAQQQQARQLLNELND